ncbi:ribosome biogenesis factor YjgA [Nitrosomonas sp. ANs5]|uniref:ribosome biogenesis factor YjgA n=1 Tax=Nitrosomonas sp. ANs5 TaxID=3423941 RepID=UPI003D33CEBE
MRVAVVRNHPKDISQSEAELEASQPSKTRRKHEMHALQALGEQLVELDPAQIAELDLPENLTEAVLEAQKISKHGARRRQLQFIGKLMRSVDAAPIQEKMHTWQHSSVQHTAWLHQLERWRDRLLSDEAALTEFAQAYPQVDVQQLRVLLRNARKEKLENKPPRSYRAVFQVLRKVIPEV